MITVKTCGGCEYAVQSALRRTLILLILTALFSVLGWICETLLFLVQYGGFTDRGLLTLPFCPIYGLGMLLTYACLRTPLSGVWRKFYSYPYKKAKRFLILIACLVLYSLLAALIASVAEFITGYVYHKLFNVRLWSYSGYSDGIYGYVSLRYSAVWGIGATVCMSLVWYPLQNLLSKLKTIPLAVISVFLVSAIITDFVINTVYLIKFGKRLVIAFIV